MLFILSCSFALCQRLNKIKWQFRKVPFVEERLISNGRHRMWHVARQVAAKLRWKYHSGIHWKFTLIHSPQTNRIFRRRWKYCLLSLRNIETSTIFRFYKLSIGIKAKANMNNFVRIIYIRYHFITRRYWPLHANKMRSSWIGYQASSFILSICIIADHKYVVVKRTNFSRSTDHVWACLCCRNEMEKKTFRFFFYLSVCLLNGKGHSSEGKLKFPACDWIKSDLLEIAKSISWKVVVRFMCLSSDEYSNEHWIIIISADASETARPMPILL